ncbi:MAG TPA: hypothetical protein PKZ76_11900, partial [Xanthomonadaceae bacterium]|nr:hypothetical protein [Xanthomonadaceae bacterium]
IDVQASVAAAGGLCARAPARLPDVDASTCTTVDGDASVDCAWLTRQLACADAQARRTAELTDALAAQLAAIRRYFAGLKALAGYDASTRGGDVLKGFAEAVDALSTEFRDNPLLSAAQVEGVGDLGALVFDGYKAEALKRALRRDATTIDAALAWQQAVFRHLADQIEAIEAQKARRAYREAVLVPYLTGEGLQADAWVIARRSGLATPALPADIRRAADAATALREVWRQILTGADDLTLLSGVLDELDTLAKAVARLKGAAIP